MLISMETTWQPKTFDAVYWKLFFHLLSVSCFMLLMAARVEMTEDDEVTGHQCSCHSGISCSFFYSIMISFEKKYARKHLS